MRGLRGIYARFNGIHPKNLWIYSKTVWFAWYLREISWNPSKKFEDILKNCVVCVVFTQISTESTQKIRGYTPKLRGLRGIQEDFHGVHQNFRTFSRNLRGIEAVFYKFLSYLRGILKVCEDCHRNLRGINHNKRPPPRPLRGMSLGYTLLKHLFLTY